MYMKAAVIYEAGGPQQLKIRQVPVPSVKEGWSLIKIKGFGLNHSEIFTRKGCRRQFLSHASWALNVQEPSRNQQILSVCPQEPRSFLSWAKWDAPLTAAMLNTHYSPINKFTLFPAICPGLIWQPFPNPAIQPLAP